MLLMLGIVVAKADTRRVLFDAGWQFTQNGKTVTVDLPHDWDIYAGPDAKSGATGTGGGWYPGGKGEYRKMFKTPDGEVACRCDRSPQESFDRLLAHFRALLPDATERQILKLI